MTKSLLFACFIFSSCVVQATELRIAAAELAPYAGKLLPHNGWVPRVLESALRESDYQVSFSFLPFRRAIATTQNGHYDAISPLYINEEREQTLTFSEPLGISQTVLFYRSSKPVTYNSINDLSGLKVAIMGGARVNDEFDNATHFDRIEVTSYEQLVRMLMMGRVDVLIGEEFVVRAVIDSNDHFAGDTLKQAKKPLATQGVYVAVSKRVPDQKAKLEAINQGLAKLKLSGEYNTILAQYGIRYDDGLLKTAIINK